jgi:hypothetical protein
VEEKRPDGLGHRGWVYVEALSLEPEVLLVKVDLNLQNVVTVRVV